MNGIKIVKACQEHIDDIVIIENLSFKIPWSRQSITEEIILNNGAIYICAALGSKTIGYAGMWHILDEGHITNIAVHPEYRSNGVGSALMEALLLTAKALDIKALTLEVKRSNQNAQSLYKKYDFKEEGFRKAYYADTNEDALIMWKHLE